MSACDCYPCSAPRRCGRCSVVKYCRRSGLNTRITPSAQPQKMKSSLTARQLAEDVCGQKRPKALRSSSH